MFASPKCSFIRFLTALEFTENALLSNFAFADAKFQRLTFYLYIDRVMHEGCIYGIIYMLFTIGTCMRVRYSSPSSRELSEAETLANVARTNVFNEIHIVLTLKCHKKSNSTFSMYK